MQSLTLTPSAHTQCALLNFETTFEWEIEKEKLFSAIIIAGTLALTPFSAHAWEIHDRDPSLMGDAYGMNQAIDGLKNNKDNPNFGALKEAMKDKRKAMNTRHQEGTASEDGGHAFGSDKGI